MRAAATAPGPVTLEYGPPWSFRTPIFTALVCARANGACVSTSKAALARRILSFMTLSPM